MDVPVGKFRAHLARHLRQNLLLRRVLDLIDGIEAKSVEAELLEPIKHVVNEKLADRRAVEGDGAAPGRLPLGMEEVRRVEMKIVSVGSEVIVDHVEQDHQIALVAGVDQALQAFRPAIDAVRRVEQHAVIAPAAIAPELRHRQKLDGRDADIHQTIEIADDAVEGPVEGEGSGVQLVEDCLFPGAALSIGACASHSFAGPPAGSARARRRFARARRDRARAFRPPEHIGSPHRREPRRSSPRTSRPPSSPWERCCRLRRGARPCSGPAPKA